MQDWRYLIKQNIYFKASTQFFHYIYILFIYIYIFFIYLTYLYLNKLYKCGYNNHSFL